MPHATDILELDHRQSDGVHVTLLWDRTTNRITVVVYDEALDGAFEVEIAPDRALDAFRHPYAYAAAQGVDETATATPAAVDA